MKTKQLFISLTPALWAVGSREQGHFEEISVCWFMRL